MAPAQGDSDGQAGRKMTPPFSPVLLLGMALRPLKPSLLQPAFDALLAAVRRRHPDILERLSDYQDSIVCIDPVDLPFVILLEPKSDDPRLTIRTAIDPAEATATIRGPLEVLIALAEGRVDGDALFFTRQLAIEGDTEVVVALRNAIDGAGIDFIEDATAALGPFATPARRAARAAVSLLGRLRRDAESLRASFLAPAMKNAETQAARIEELETEIKALRKAARRGGAA